MAPRIAALLKGEVDIITQLPPDHGDRVNANPSTRTVGALYAGLYVLAVNSKRPPLDNPLVKQALAPGVDRQLIVPGQDGYRVAECPSLPGCVSQGKTREERSRSRPSAERALEQGKGEVDDEGGGGQVDRSRSAARGARPPGRAVRPRPAGVRCQFFPHHPANHVERRASVDVLK